MTVIALFWVLHTAGQFNTGASYITVATQALQSFQSTSSEFGSNVNGLSFGFVPEAGYFIRNRLSVGGLVFADLERTLGEFGYSEYRFVFGSPSRPDCFTPSPGNGTGRGAVTTTSTR